MSEPDRGRQLLAKVARTARVLRDTQPDVMPAPVARLYEQLDRATDPRERAQIEEALANHHA